MPSDSEDELHPLLPGSPASRKRSPLGVMGLAVFSYFSVCGGPFGLEVAIAAGGPAPVVASILTLALLWAMPVALMTSELGSALPSPSAPRRVAQRFDPCVVAMASQTQVRRALALGRDATRMQRVEPLGEAALHHLGRGDHRRARQGAGNTYEDRRT